MPPSQTIAKPTRVDALFVGTDGGSSTDATIHGLGGPLRDTQHSNR